MERTHLRLAQQRSARAEKVVSTGHFWDANADKCEPGEGQQDFQETAIHPPTPPPSQ